VEGDEPALLEAAVTTQAGVDPSLTQQVTVWDTGGQSPVFRGGDVNGGPP
jgi:hypothetical protein